MKSIAIVIVCYNRIDGVKRLCKSLLEADYNGNQDVTLIFSIDKSDTNIVADYAESVEWPHGIKIIRKYNNRQGLKQHILKCGDLTSDYDAVIILEDDIIVSNCFYRYASQAIDFYWNDPRIAGISLYSFQKNWLNWLLRFEPCKTHYDAYFLRVAQSWGQVWTRPKWNEFRAWFVTNPNILPTDNIPKYLKEWPDSSWLKYHDKYCIETNKYFVYPYYSLSSNCSDVGSHAMSNTNDHQVELQFDKKEFLFPLFNQSAIIYDEYMNRQFLGKYVNIPDEQLTTDLYCTHSSIDTRFLLTTKKLNFKILKTFQLFIRPIEASVIHDYQGTGIYLYDTNEKVRNKEKSSIYDLYLYSLRSHDYRRLLRLSLKLTIKEIFNRLQSFICR